MIVVTNRIPVNEPYRDQFEERFRSRAGMVEKAPGFIRFELLRPIQGDFYQVVTYWKDHESFEAWTSSQAFQRGHAPSQEDAPKEKPAPPPPDMFKGQSVLEVAEVIQQAGKELE
jgi:heme oxygenase (mycobilin-producing)